MTKTDKPAATSRATREDKRRPKALKPYVLLWVICVLCVIFALVALVNQG